MTDTIITIAVPAYILIIFGALFLANAVLSLVLVYYKSKLTKLTKETP